MVSIVRFLIFFQIIQTFDKNYHINPEKVSFVFVFFLAFYMDKRTKSNMASFFVFFCAKKESSFNAFPIIYSHLFLGKGIIMITNRKFQAIFQT